MADQHRATPEQWDDAGAFASDTRACLIELRDRIAAAEQRISELEQRPIPGSVELAADHSADASKMVAPAGGLVERVADAMDGGTESQASAAILAVADRLEAAAWFSPARWLRKEVQRSHQS